GRFPGHWVRYVHSEPHGPLFLCCRACLLPTASIGTVGIINGFVRRLGRLTALLLSLGISPSHAGQTAGRSLQADTVIINAQVADGTGATLKAANVRIIADRIA